MGTVPDGRIQLLSVKDSLASRAYDEIVYRLFGPEGFVFPTFPHPDVTRWLNYTIATTWNRWRRTYLNYVKTTDALEEQVQALYEG